MKSSPMHKKPDQKQASDTTQDHTGLDAFQPPDFRNMDMQTFYDFYLKMYADEPSLDRLRQYQDDFQSNLSKAVHYDFAKRYSCEQACAILKISRRTLTNWIQKKWITPIRVGGRLYFSPSEIKKILE